MIAGNADDNGGGDDQSALTIFLAQINLRDNFQLCFCGFEQQQQREKHRFCFC